MDRESMRGYYFRVYGFMLDVLGLSGASLLVFAVIYSFSWDGEGRFRGSREYVSAATGVTERTVTRELSGLCERGLIVRQSEPDNRFPVYSVSRSLVRAHEKYAVDREGGAAASGGQNVRGGTTKCQGRVDKMSEQGGQNVRGGRTKCQGRVDKMSTNNIEDNTSYIKDNNKAINRDSVCNERDFKKAPHRRSYGSSYYEDTPEHAEWLKASYMMALSRSFGEDASDT